MKLSHEVNNEIIERIIKEMMEEWPDCPNPNVMRSLIRTAARRAISDFIYYQLTREA